MVFLNTCLKQDMSGPSKSSSKILEKEVGLSVMELWEGARSFPRHLWWRALPLLFGMYSVIYAMLSKSQNASWQWWGQLLAKRDKDAPAQRKLQEQSDSWQLLSATLIWFQSPQPALRGRWRIFSGFCSSLDEFSSFSIHKAILHTSSWWLNCNSAMVLNTKISLP